MQSSTQNLWSTESQTIIQDSRLDYLYVNSKMSSLLPVEQLLDCYLIASDGSKMQWSAAIDVFSTDISSTM